MSDTGHADLSVRHPDRRIARTLRAWTADDPAQPAEEFVADICALVDASLTGEATSGR